MMKIKKGLGFLIATFLVVFLVAGCRISAAETTAAAEEKPHAGKTLKVLATEVEFYKHLSTIAEDFTEKTGMTLEIETLPDASFLPKAQLVYSSGSADYDILASNNIYIGQIASGKWAVPLNNYVKDDPTWDFDDFLPKLIDQVTIDGNILGIPSFGDAVILYYNKEMFAEAGLTKPPDSYEELMEDAKILNKPDKGQYGIAMRGSREASGNGYSWIMIWTAFGGSWHVDGKKPYVVLDEPEAIKAAEFWGELLGNYGPPGIQSYTYNEMLQSFEQGKTAMMIDSTVWMPRVENPDESLVAGKTGYHCIPGKGVPAVTWSWFLNAGSKDKDAAWEGIKWMTSKEVITKQVEDKVLAAVARQSVLDSDIFAKTYNQEWGKANATALAMGISEYTPRIVQGPQIREILAVALSDILTKQATAEEAMIGANKQVEKLLEEASK